MERVRQRQKIRKEGIGKEEVEKGEKERKTGHEKLDEHKKERGNCNFG